MRSIQIRQSVALAIGLSFVGPAAYAQEAMGTSQKASEEPGPLQEIMVTAERRSVDILTIPIQITAIPASQLESLQPNTSLEDLQSVVPSFTVNGTAGSFQNINIRGVGNTSFNPSVTTGVVVIRDGLPDVETNALGEPFFDLRGLEVLRGPQGTFVGASSTGGALLINSADPSLAGFEGYFEGILGNYTDRRFDGAVNMPVNDQLAFRVAFNAERRASFFRNIGSQNLTPAGEPLSDPGQVNDLNARISALWKPSADFQALLKVELNQSSTGGVPGQPNQNPFPNPAVPGQMQYVSSYAFSTHQPYVLNYEATNLINDSQTDRYGLELRYTLPNEVVLRSQSGYQDHYFRYSTENSNDAFNDGIDYTLVGPKDRNYYQEINAISPDTGRLTWVAGAAAFYRDTPVFASSNRLSLPAAGPLSSGPSPETALDIVSVTRSLGVFGQLSYKLLDTLQLQAGVRENWDNNFNGGAITVIGPFGPLAVIPNTGQFKSSTPTAKVGLNWSPVEEQFIYAFWARGYKSGGVNIGTGLPFEDEHVDDYEAGINSRFFDGHLQTRLGSYYMTYKGMQEDIFNAKAGYMDEVVNLANSTIKGLELSIQSRFGGLWVNLSVAYNESKLGAVSSADALIDGGVVASYRLPPLVQAVPSLFPASVFNYAPYTEKISGEQNPYSPKLTANASVDYAILVGPGTIRPVVSFSHTDKQFASLFQSDNFYLMPARNVWDVSTSYEAGSWLTQVYAKNVTNSVYVSGYSGNTEYYGAPRQIGLRVRKTF